MRPTTSRSAWPTHTSTWHDWVRATSTASSTTSSTSSRADPHPGHVRPTRPRCPQLWQRHPAWLKSTDTTSCSTRRSVRARRTSARPTTARSTRGGLGPQPGDRLGLAAALDGGLDLEDGVADDRRAGADPDVDPAAEAVAQVGVQGRLERGRGGGRGPDGEVVERPLLEHVEGHRRGVAEVRRGQGLDMAGDVTLVAVAPTVVVAGQLVEQIAVVDQLPQLEHQHAGPLAVDEQHPDALVLLGDRLELGHRRSLVDHHLAAHRNRQRHHLPEPVGRAGEHDQAAGRRTVDPGPHVLLEALEVALQRRGAARLRPGRPQHPLELELVVAVAGQTPPVDIEVAGRHRSIDAPEPGQLANGGLGDHSHGASVGSGPPARPGTCAPDRRQPALDVLASRRSRAGPDHADRPGTQAQAIAPGTVTDAARASPALAAHPTTTGSSVR